jgi:hypothetical protein
MKRALATALLILVAAAPPRVQVHASSVAAWSPPHVRIHRGAAPGMGPWHHRRDRLGDGAGYGWPSFGYGYDAAPPSPSGAGFFEDGDIRMQGRRVVYDYDRGYPYEHYRYSRLPRRGW